MHAENILYLVWSWKEVKANHPISRLDLKQPCSKQMKTVFDIIFQEHIVNNHHFNLLRFLVLWWKINGHVAFMIEIPCWLEFGITGWFTVLRLHLSSFLHHLYHFTPIHKCHTKLLEFLRGGKNFTLTKWLQNDI